MERTKLCSPRIHVELLKFYLKEWITLGKLDSRANDTFLGFKILNVKLPLWNIGCIDLRVVSYSLTKNMFSFTMAIWQIPASRYGDR